jgi:hypothetical protein
MPQMRTHPDIVEDNVEACTAVDLRWDESSPVTLVIRDSVERSCLDRVHARKTIGTETFLTNFTRQIHIVNNMFCLASRSDLASLDKIATDDASLQKNALSSWSQETNQLAIRILAVLEQEYIPQSNKTALLGAIQDTRAILTGKLVHQNPK